MLDAVRTFASANPVWGICAGMILLADELAGTDAQPLVGGLKVTVERNAFGRQVRLPAALLMPLSFRAPHVDRPPFEQIDSRFRSMELTGAAAERGLGDSAYFIRAPLVESVGEGVEVLATLPGDASKVAAVRQDKLMATCFHPEISSDDSWLQYFLTDVAALAPASAAAVPPPKPTSSAPWHSLPATDADVDTAVKRAFAVFQQGGESM